MEQVLVAREAAVKFFKRYEVFIMPFLKFLLGLFIFGGITSVGHSHALMDAVNFSPGLLTFLFALLFTIMPMNMSWFIIILTVTLQFSANMQVAATVFIFLMLIFLFYARMATKESILIIFMIIAYHYNLPFIVPLVAGLYFPITAIIPITIGVFVFAQIDGLLRLMSPAAFSAATTAADRDFTDILGELPGAFSEVYTTIMSSFSAPDVWLLPAIVFAMVIVLVHFTSRLSIDYAKEIAIGLGCVMMIFGFIVAQLFADGSENIVMVVLGTIICGFLAWLIRFFDGVLDYQRAESVQFEDDNNYYHVKVVPKVIMTKSQRSVKRIRPQLPENPLEEGHN
jgi:hypothetical protein